MTSSVGMVTKPSNEPTQDFSIHNEDFPALPGPNYKDPTLSNDDSKTVSQTDRQAAFSLVVSLFSLVGVMPNMDKAEMDRQPYKASLC